MRKTTLITLLVVFISGFLNAQQEPQFTSYMFNSLSYNPAYAGSHEYLSIRLLYRNQWLGFEGAPESQTVTGHAPLNDRIGIGLSLYNDDIGVRSSTGASVSYAYRFLLGPGKLSLGIQAGLTSWRADFDQLKFRDPQGVDGAFLGTTDNQLLPNFGAGIFYYSKTLYAGISIPNLIENRLGSVEVNSVVESARTRRHYYLSAGAVLPLAGDDLIFKPSIIVRNVGLFSSFSSNNSGLFEIGAPTQFSVDASLLFLETLWIGLSYRSAFEVANETTSVDSANVWASFQLANGFRIGGAFDQGLSTIGAQSFEIMLGYDFDYEVKKMNTPRYF